MSTDLAAWVSQRLDSSDLDDDAGVVVLSALEGEQALDECLDSPVAIARPDVEADSASDANAPRGTFVQSITVEGFRGIGPATSVDFKPGPGLTVVAGRNGSGKSSIAEALELVLTGGTYRWKQKSAQWKEQWRNLHHPDPSSIKVQLLEEGTGPITVTSSWRAGTDDVEDRVTKTQRLGDKQEDGLGSLGWERPLERFRPILSYDELGGLLEGSPSELYDALASVLGVSQLTDGLKRLQARLKDAKAPETFLSRRRKELQARAADTDDERATAAASLLKKSAPDVSALRGIATGITAIDHGPLAALRTLVGLVPPCDADEAQETARVLRAAVARLADAGVDAGGRRLARLELEEQALRVHANHGDMTCPVCHQGELESDWAAHAAEHAAAERRALRAVSEARQDLDVAVSSARRLLLPRPACLSQTPVPEMRAQVQAAREAWDAWVAVPQEESEAALATGVADHLEMHVDLLVASLEHLRSSANQELAARQDMWEPLAAEISSWCQDWDAWLAQKPQVELLGRAEAWLKANDIRLKNERLAPIRDGAREAWAKLRQESNVEIGNLTLEGAATRRRVRIDAAVDGVEAGTLAVLSQGELHALALALFLPRATMAESPFRFVILDDPVQAMDPAKIDGLVELLSELAQTHQVIVMSHDDRLPAAVRRSQARARIIEVSRGKDSIVSCRSGEDPASRYLNDAFALLKDDELPESILRRALPGLLRFAVESAARERFLTTQLKSGRELLLIEAEWDSTTSTRDRVSLAIYGEVRPLDAWAGAPYRKFGLRTASSAMHNGLKAGLDPLTCARDVERVVKDIRAGAK